MLNEKEIIERAEQKLSTVMQIEVQKIGSTYTAFLFGDDIASYSAFGDTPEEAINNVIKSTK